MTRRTLLAALLAVSSASVVPAPARARPRYGGPGLAGSYFGRFQSSIGDVWDADVTINQQAGSHLDARLNLAAILRDVPLTGSCNRLNAVTLVGAAGYGRNVIRIKMRGTCRANTEDNLTTFQGEYVVTGARREKGTFLLSGRPRQ